MELIKTIWPFTSFIYFLFHGESSNWDHINFNWKLLLNVLNIIYRSFSLFWVKRSQVCIVGQVLQKYFSLCLLPFSDSTIFDLAGLYVYHGSFHLIEYLCVYQWMSKPRSFLEKSPLSGYIAIYWYQTKFGYLLWPHLYIFHLNHFINGTYSK